MEMKKYPKKTQHYLLLVLFIIINIYVNPSGLWKHSLKCIIREPDKKYHRKHYFFLRFSLLSHFFSFSNKTKNYKIYFSNSHENFLLSNLCDTVSPYMGLIRHPINYIWTPIWAHEGTYWECVESTGGLSGNE